MSAIMTAHRFGIHMQRQGDVAIWARQNIPTIAAHHEGRVAAPIQQQDDLFFAGQAVCDFFL